MTKLTSKRDINRFVKETPPEILSLLLKKLLGDIGSADLYEHFHKIIDQLTLSQLTELKSTCGTAIEDKRKKHAGAQRIKALMEEEGLTIADVEELSSITLPTPNTSPEKAEE